MLKNLMKNGITVFAAVGVLALVGCNDKSGGNAAAPTSTPTGQGEQPDADHSHAGDADHSHAGDADHGATDHGGAGDGDTGSVALDDSSAAAALATYVNRLKAGDFMGAAEICVAEAPGTEQLITLGTNFANMASDPETASIGMTAKAIMTDEFKTIETTKVLEEDGVVIYEVAVINKAAVNIRVENKDGVWRVIPPISGTPTG